MHGFHSIDARGNDLVPYLFSAAGNDPERFRDIMQLEAGEIRRLLRDGGVDYEALKSALIPTSDGLQVAFLYDWLDDPSWNYAVAFASHYLPHIRARLQTSMLHGDLLDYPGSFRIEHLQEAIVRATPGDVSWATQYAVYFSNLRPGDVASLHAALSGVPRYTGYVDVTFGGPIRDYFARTLSPTWVINGRKVVLSHGGDDPFVSHDDPVGFPFAKHGFAVTSLVESYFVAFLSYKIEALDANLAPLDMMLNLAASTGKWIDARTVDVIVPPAKLAKYLLLNEHKSRLMTSIGLNDVTPDALADIVREKLNQGYIYDLKEAVDGTPLFAVSAEFEKPDGGMARRLLALKYDDRHSAISLVSMY